MNFKFFFMPPISLINYIKNIFPKSKLGWSSLILFLVISIPLTIYGQNERSGFTLMTSPIDISHRTNTLLGYTCIIGECPIFEENIPSIGQLMLFSGAQGFTNQSVYAIRPLYAFFATLLTPIIGIFNAFIIINFLSWAVCAWITWRFTKKVFKDELASFFAVVFVSGGLGIIAHIGDYSAHLIGFTAYYLGILILYESEVWFKSQPLEKHLLIGFCLAILCLTYTSSIALVFAYICIALPFNKWYKLLVASIIALSSRSIWVAYLNNIGVTLPDTEGEYLDIAINFWSTTLFNEPLNFIIYIFKFLWEFITCFESPLLLTFGLISIIIFIIKKPSRERNYPFYWFCVSLFFLPIIAGIVYAPSAGARGYLIYGISLFVYCSLGGLIAKGIRTSGWIKITTITIALMLIATQLIWSTAHFGGYLGPVKTFLLGYDNGLPVLASGKMDILSLTGKEPTPIMFGGDSTLKEAGLQINDWAKALESNQLSFSMALKTRSLFFAYFIVIIFLYYQRKNFKLKMLLNMGLIVFLIMSSYLSIILVRNIPNTQCSSRRINLQEGEKITYTVSVDNFFLNQLNEKIDIGDQIILYIPVFSSAIAAPKNILTVYSNQENITDYFNVLNQKDINLAAKSKNKEFHYPIMLTINNPKLLVSKLSKSLNLTINIKAHSFLSIKGWQKINLPARMLGGEIFTARKIDILPAIELRLVNSDGVIKVAGF